MSESQVGQSDDETKVETKAKWVDTWLGRITLAAVASIFGVSGTILVTSYNNQMRFLDYWVAPTASLIQRPDLGGKQLAVTIDGKPVDNLNTLTLYVANNSGIDFKTVPLEITFKSADGKPIEMVRETVKPDRAAESLVPTTMPTNGVVIKRKYQFNVINRMVDNKGVLVGQYVFTGPTPPDVTVDVDYPGLSTQPQLIGNADGKTGKWLTWVEAAMILSSFVFAVATLIIERQRTKIHEQRYLSEIEMLKRRLKRFSGD